MARTRDAIEARFRAGSRWFLIVGVLSALASTALYKGVAVKLISMFSLATPMVLDMMLRSIDGRWIWVEELHYYCYVFSLGLAGLFALMGLLSIYASHTGSFLKLERVFGIFAKLGSTVGIAHLVGSRLFYFAGICLYILDGLLAFGLEAVFRSHFSDLRLVVLMNLGFHCLVLMFLSHGFMAGFERESKASLPVQED